MESRLSLVMISPGAIFILAETAMPIICSVCLMTHLPRADRRSGGTGSHLSFGMGSGQRTQIEGFLITLEIPCGVRMMWG